MQLLVRNEVGDFDDWKSVFDANLEPPREAGIGGEAHFVTRAD